MNFQFWLAAILNIAAISAAILKNNVVHDTSEMHPELYAKNSVKICYRLAAQAGQTPARAHTHTQSRTRTHTHTGHREGSTD